MKTKMNTERIIEESLKEILLVNKIESNTQLWDLGLDSLMAVELAVSIEEIFGVKMDIDIFSNNPTLESLSANIDNLISK